MDRSRQIGAWLVVGSLVVSLGASVLVRAAFSGNILRVYIGVLVFFGGYQLLVLTVEERRGWRTLGHRLLVHRQQWRTEPTGMVRRYTGTVVGALGIAVGIQLFAITILRPEPAFALPSGVLSFCGYVLSHRAIDGGIV